ncbi:MAG: CCA tRNA nucleotidyltransferase [Alphaproteobacteria bacterium]
MVETTKISLTGHFKWAASPEAKALVATLGESHVRFVGGAVRDSLLGKKISDIDVATTHDPETVMEKLASDKFKVIPTGLKHGTITAIINHQTFEITTLRHDVETFGRHARVEFHDDWQADARRRDFTINALYLGADGTFFDYFSGRADLQGKIIRFIGDASSRIEEDGLRILRLFRFHAWYGAGDIDPGALEAVGNKLDMLDHLSAERVRQEVIKTLAALDPVFEFEAMEKIGVLKCAFPGFEFNFSSFRALVAAEGKLEKISRLRRLGALFKSQGAAISKRLKLSNKERDRLLKMETLVLPHPLSDQAIRVDIYLNGHENFEDRLFLSGKNLADIKAALKIADDFSPPKFPVTGQDLESQGMAPSIEMGERLKVLEQRWVGSDFTLTKSDLLKS